MMTRRRTSLGWWTIFVVAVTLVSCKSEITILCQTACLNLKVGDQKIGAMAPGDTKKVEVKGIGATAVEWLTPGASDKDVDVPQADTIWGEDAEDGAVWNLYLDHGSFEVAPATSDTDSATDLINDSDVDSSSAPVYVYDSESDSGSDAVPDSGADLDSGV